MENRKKITKEKRGHLTMRVLASLLEKALEFGDLWMAYTTLPHRSPNWEIKAKARKFREARENYAEAISEKQKLRSLVYKLKKQGLVEADYPGWAITDRGLTKFRQLKQESATTSNFTKEPNTTLNIIAFDIPEKHRSQRNWLRFSLKDLGFTMLQKSVWFGKFKIPEEFIVEIKKRGLINWVQILGVTHNGTLESLV